MLCILQPNRVRTKYPYLNLALKHTQPQLGLWKAMDGFASRQHMLMYLLVRNVVNQQPIDHGPTSLEPIVAHNCFQTSKHLVTYIYEDPLPPGDSLHP